MAEKKSKDADVNDTKIYKNNPLGRIAYGILISLLLIPVSIKGIYDMLRKDTSGRIAYGITLFALAPFILTILIIYHTFKAIISTIYLPFYHLKNRLFGLPFGAPLDRFIFYETGSSFFSSPRIVYMFFLGGYVLLAALGFVFPAFLIPILLLGAGLFVCECILEVVMND